MHKLICHRITPADFQNKQAVDHTLRNKCVTDTSIMQHLAHSSNHLSSNSLQMGISSLWNKLPQS